MMESLKIVWLIFYRSHRDQRTYKKKKFCNNKVIKILILTCVICVYPLLDLCKCFIKGVLKIDLPIHDIELHT